MSSSLKSTKAQSTRVSTFQPISNSFKNKSIISLKQFDTDSIKTVFKIATAIKENQIDVSSVLKNKLITLLFFEPSSRTFGSFISATKRLSGQTIEIINPQQFSSVSKGETFEDTIKVFESYSDAIILRHPEAGASEKAASAAFFVPIINAGDGIGEHPTQALLDLFTIYEHHQSLSNLTGLIAGDIKNGRTVHSLLEGLSLYDNNTIYLLSPQELKLDSNEKKRLQQKGLTIHEISEVEEIPTTCHFWYWTRVQKERFKDESEYKKVNNKYIVDNKLLQTHGNKDLILMHPLPRVGEIKEEVDSDPRAIFLTKQIKNGLYIRMALLGLVFGKL